MARAKGLYVHSIKEGVFSIITKGFATDEQIFGKPSYRYIKIRFEKDFGCGMLDTGEIEAGVYLVLKNANIYGVNPTYMISEYDDRNILPTNVYNIYKQN